jgi:KDO2-lipid IV(A) lauroyltransferase
MSDKSKSKLVCWGEYALMRTYFATIRLLPERVAIWVAIGLSNLTWLLKPRRRRTAEEQIAAAMPGRFTPAEVRTVARRAFIHVGLAVTETAWFSHRPPETVLERFEINGLDQLLAALEPGRGLIAATGHFGNWELFGAAFAQRVCGFTAIAKQSSNPLITRYVTALRERYGMEIQHADEGLRGVVGVLRQGKGLAMLVDRHARNSGVPVTFLGRPCWTTAVVATLATRLDVPLFVGYSLRQGCRFRHRGRMIGPVERVHTGDRKADVIANTQRINDILEEVVREHPEQWGRWMYRRWRPIDRKKRPQKSAEQGGSSKEGRKDRK